MSPATASASRRAAPTIGTVPGHWRSLGIAALLACGLGIYFWAGRERRPPQAPAAQLPPSARYLLPTPHKDAVDLTVAAHQELDYRLGMQAGATLVYTWSTGSGGRALSGTFPDQSLSRPASEGHGAFEARSSGWYHWKWQNPGAWAVKVHVKLNGYYEPAIMPPTQMPYDR